MTRNTYKIEDSEEVLLPIGIERDGVRYRKVIIDEWCGLDHEELTSKSAKRNPYKAMGNVLRRLIQEIPGIMPQKDDPYIKISSSWVDNMFGVDRDTLMYQSLVVSGEGTKEVPVADCPKCGKGELVEDLNLADIEVVALGEDEPTSIPFTLPRGVTSVRTVNGKKERVKSTRGEFKIPTGAQLGNLKSAGENELKMFTRLLSSCVEMEQIGKLGVTEAQRMRLKDRKYLMNFFSDRIPGPQGSFETECPDCGHTYEQSVDVSQFFF